MPIWRTILYVQIMGSEIPLAPKPKSAVPPYLLDGTSQTPRPSRKRERENLTCSIKSTYGRRLATSPENIQNGPFTKRRKGHDAEGEDADGTLHSLPARDPRDEAPIITPPATSSRPASPYTLQPPIDYDGLSWPSTSCFLHRRQVDRLQ